MHLLLHNSTLGQKRWHMAQFAAKWSNNYSWYCLQFNTVGEFICFTGRVVCDWTGQIVEAVGGCRQLAWKCRTVCQLCHYAHGKTSALQVTTVHGTTGIIPPQHYRYQQFTGLLPSLLYCCAIWHFHQWCIDIIFSSGVSTSFVGRQWLHLACENESDRCSACPWRLLAENAETWCKSCCRVVVSVSNVSVSSRYRHSNVSVSSRSRLLSSRLHRTSKFKLRTIYVTTKFSIFYRDT